MKYTLAKEPALNNTYQLKLTYPQTFSLHNITSLVESVNGVRIQHLSFISKGKEVAGTVIFEASDLFKFNSVVRLIRARNEVLIEEGASVSSTL